MFLLFFGNHIIQLTNSYFSEGLKPPTSEKMMNEFKQSIQKDSGICSEHVFLSATATATTTHLHNRYCKLQECDFQDAHPVRGGFTHTACDAGRAKNESIGLQNASDNS